MKSLEIRRRKKQIEVARRDFIKNLKLTVIRIGLVPVSL